MEWLLVYFVEVGFYEVYSIEYIYSTLIKKLLGVNYEIFKKNSTYSFRWNS